MNPSPFNRPATTPASSSQFSPHQQAAAQVRPGSTYPSDRPVAPARPSPRIRSASTTLTPVVRPGPTSWRRSGAGPSRVSPYNTTNAALAAREAAEARRAREFDPDYLVYPTPTKSFSPASASVRVNPDGSNNPAATTTTTAAASASPPQQPQNRPVQPRLITEAEAKQAENAAHLERSLAAIAQIAQRAKDYCDLDPGAGFQFDPSPRR